MMAGIQHKPVGIFWDIENCSVPKAKCPSDVIAHIRNFFVFNRLNHREYEFIISCDVTRLRKDIPEDINKAGGVTLAHVNGSSKNAADEKLRENMKKFVDTHASSSVSPVLILISGDIDFVNDLRGYQTRLGCTVVLIHAATCSSQFKVGWNETYCFMSFCSAVKDNPTLNAKNIAKKPTNPKSQTGPPSNQQKQNGPLNPKNQGAPSEARPKNPKQHPKQKAENPINGGQSLPCPPPPPPVAPQHNGTGNRNKTFNNNGPNAGNNANQPTMQQHPKPPRNNNNNKGNNDPSFANMSTKDAADKPAIKQFILMVGGLPGKMDFKILKENLQFQANKVHGKVKYVKNGQAFITFNHKFNADRAVELFNGKQVFGKTLNVSFTKSIPFEDQPNGKPKPTDSDGKVMLEKGNAAGGSKHLKNKDSNSNAPTATNNSNLSNDPVLAGLGSIIGGIVANRIAAANPGNKSPEACPIQ